MKRFTILSLLALLCGAALPVAADDVPGVRLPCEPAFPVGLARETSSAFDGVYESTSTSARPILFDIGTPRHITGITFLIGSGSWTLSSMKKSLSFEASVDGVTYETIWANNNRDLVREDVYKTFAVDAGHQGPYRYFRVSARDTNNAYAKLYLCDMRVLSEELSVDGAEPKTWIDRSAVSMPGTNEVTFAAKVLAAPAGNATVYAAYAKKDLGLSLADWQAKGTVVELGSGAAGADVSKSVADIPDGNYIVRYFAVSETDEYAWPLHYDMVIGSHDMLGTMYSLSSASFKNVYNENIANTDYSTMKQADGHSVIFSLQGLPAGEIISSLRVWHSSGYRSYLVGLPVEVSFDDVDLETGSEEAQVVGDRVVRTRASFPEMTWERAGAFTNAALTIAYMRDATAVTAEIALDAAVMRRRPTYLRVTGCTDINSLWPLELELRAVKLPPEPEGTARLDEVGSAFARVSGHIDTCGTGGGVCTVYLVTTPTGGGATVSSVVAASVATETSFEGTGTGLRGSTEYSWQVVASNETEGTVLASGVFTTQQGSGSLKPIVALTGAEAQDDGTVLIGYNLSDAGEGFAKADVYVRYGTDPEALSGELLVRADTLGEGSVVVAGLPLGQSLYLALVAKNAGGEESEVTEPLPCKTVGPCGLVGTWFSPNGCTVTLSGALEPRGLGGAQVYLDYGSETGTLSESVLAGTVAAGADAAFSFDVVLPRQNSVFCKVRVVNTCGDDEWTVESDEVQVPLGVRLPCQPIVSESLEKTFKSFNGVYAATYSPVQLSFDLGEPKTINGVAFMVADRDAGVLSNMSDLRLEASLDGVTYETVFANEDRPFTKGGVYESFAVDAEHHGPYRYFRTQKKLNIALNLCDLRVLSTELAVQGNRPSYWSYSLGEETSDAVTFSGKLLSAPAGSAHVYAVYATSDLGDDLAVWQARGTVVDLGVVDEGEGFSAEVPVASGAYWCRYYAVSGNDTNFSPCLYSFSSATVSLAPSKIYVSGDAAASLKSIYDGDTGSFAWYNTSVPTVVLPLDEIPAGCRLASVRVWMRPGYQGHLYDLSADVSYDAADLDAGSTVVQTKNDRTMMGVPAFPAMTWVRGGAFDQPMDALDLSQVGTRYGAEFLLSREISNSRPKFLRVNQVNATCTFAEFELRLAEIPAEPEGWAQIDEIGAAFARVSGHVNSVGTGGGNCTIRFEATPTAGGDKVVSVVTTDVGDESDFEGTATGLRGSTEYAWQMIAANETAESVIASGTFTTAQSAGSPVPIVAFTGATANDDGTVTVGYNLSDAGEGYATADLYVRYGTNPDDLSGELLAAQGIVGEGAVAVSGLPPGQFLYLALVAKNEGGAASEVTEQKTCETVGPCGLEDVGFYPEARMVTVAGTLAPRGLGEAKVYLDYGATTNGLTETALAGIVEVGAAADFSFDVPMPDWNVVFCRLRVENSFAGASWSVTSEETSFPLGTRMPCLPTNAELVHPQFNGVYTTKYGPNRLDFDLGALRMITGVTFMIADLPDYVLAGMTGMKIEASADGTAFETIFENGDRPYRLGGVYSTFAVDDDHHGPYRYFRCSMKSGRVNVCDMRVLSKELAVEGSRPTYWNFTLGEAKSGEVGFRAKLVSAPTGSAHVYAVYSRFNLGDAIGAWRASGTTVDLGVAQDGETVSAQKGDVPAGAYFCRYFAVSGSDVSAMPGTYTFTAATTSLVPSKIYISGDAASSVKSIYDGDMESYPWYSATNPEIVLPLGEMPAGYRLAAVRVWVRPGYPGHVLGVTAQVSSDDVNLDAVATEVQTKNGRTVMGVSAFPEMTWTAAGGFDRQLEAADHSAANLSVGEFSVFRAAAAKHPKFIRIRRSSDQSALAFAEIELRCVPDPGLAVIVK